MILPRPTKSTIMAQNCEKFLSNFINHKTEPIDMNHQINEYFGLSNEKTYSTFAHGHLNVMGGIADYSGSLVIQSPISEKSSVAIRKTDDNLINIKSVSENKILKFTITTEKIKSLHHGDFEAAKQLFEKEKWPAYIIGSVIILLWEQKIELTGFEILTESNIPINTSISSSAPLVVATMKVLSEYYQLNLTGVELSKLAQKVENLIAGSSCELMDHLGAYFGKLNHLLPILCQPANLFESKPLPQNVFMMGIDSGIKPTKGEHDYRKIRTATFMGYSIMANKAGIDTQTIKEISRNELPFDGYLCNVRVPYYNAKFSKILPKIMLGSDFIKQYGDVYDYDSTINPKTKYPILNATKHAIFENSRSEKFQKSFLSIEKTLSKKIPYKLMGNFMDESNKSYSTCGLGSEKTDQLVQMAYLARNKGVYGAKITGNGSGGTVAILCIGEQGKQAVRDIWTEYQEKNMIEVSLFG